MVQNTLTPLARLVEDWLVAHNTNGAKLFELAELPNALYTQIKRGSSPRPDTIRALSEAMHVPRGRLFQAAGYADSEDLWIVDPDPEMEELFSIWKKISPEKKPLMMKLLMTATDDEID